MSSSRHTEDTSPQRTKAKRPKTNQACASCRKHKTRCELLEAPQSGPVRCHRCKVLNLSCSYEDMDPEYLPLPSGDSRRSSPARGSPPLMQRIVHDDPGFSSLGPPVGQDGQPKYEPNSWRFWSFVQLQDSPGLDWSAPVYAVQGLSGRTNSSQTAGLDNAFANILTGEQVDHLLNIFEHQYGPWLIFTQVRSGRSTVLDLVRCCIASRHLDISSRNQVSPRLHSLVEKVVSKLLLDPRPFESVETCAALLILGIWTPLGSSSGASRDGRGLVAAAASMAANLRLNQASSRALSLPHSPDSPTPASASILTNNARLWVAITNAESMLCIGTGRTPLTRRSISDRHLFQNSIPGGRDSRLHLLAELGDHAQRGSCLQLTSTSVHEVEAWYSSVISVLEGMDLSPSILNPQTEYEAFYLHMVQAYQSCCKLVVLYHALFEARYVCSVHGIPDASAIIRPQGISIISTWSKQMFSLSESILGFIARAEVSLLGTCPDSFFSMIGFAAGIIVGTKLDVWLQTHNDISTSVDRILSKVTSHMSRCAYSPDHAAHKVAQLIDTMVSAWETKGASPSGLTAPFASMSIPDISGQRTVTPGPYSYPSAPAPFIPSMPAQSTMGPRSFSGYYPPGPPHP